jgi:hypothetical protein
MVRRTKLPGVVRLIGDDIRVNAHPLRVYKDRSLRSKIRDDKN